MFLRAFTILCILLPAVSSAATDLSPKTAAAFDKYVAVAEQRMSREVAQGQAFLWTDGLPAARKADSLQRLKNGEIIVERLHLDGSQDVPDGLLHHWIGTVFVPGANLRETVALMQDYDRHSSLFGPNVAQSKLLERHGETFKVFLRFYMKKVIGVTLNTEHVAQFTAVGADREYSSIHSTRVAEVDDAGTPSEHEERPGTGHGFMWRLNTYWRYLERDGGTYIQCESITLSRDVPFGLGWLIKPFVTEVPRDSLNFMLGRVRGALVKH
ncbi:MAG TPA: hypothetical protein VH458_15025 [Vicinamibacterales bacterium]|jgi:hypothetical protein